MPLFEKRGHIVLLFVGWSVGRSVDQVMSTPICLKVAKLGTVGA